MKLASERTSPSNQNSRFRMSEILKGFKKVRKTLLSIFRSSLNFKLFQTLILKTVIGLVTLEKQNLA